MTRVVQDVTISNPETDFGTTHFSDHRTIHLMKLMPSTMLSAAIKRQYSSELAFLRDCTF